MNFNSSKMKNKGISLSNKVEKEKKVVDSREQLKMLDKIQGILKLQQKFHLLDNLESIFVGKIDQKKKKRLYSLLQIWSNQSDLKDAISQSSKTLIQDLPLYKQSQTLSSRVYIKAQHYFSSKGNAQLYGLLRQMKLGFSFDRYWWRRQIIEQYKDSNELQNKKEKQEIIAKVLAVVKLFKDEFLHTLFDFLEKIGLLLTNQQVKNVFMMNMERITSVIQRQLYLQSISLPLLSAIKYSTLKGKQRQIKLQQQVKKYLPNYHFYLSNSNKSIESLHLKYAQYEYLEQAHDYIQWMFPNHFKSIFNEDSYPLNYAQSRLFHSSQIIGIKIIKSLVIFLDFWGISFDCLSLRLQLISLERLENVLIYRTHNLLRLKRILAFLSITGFREVALALIDFLLKQTSQIKQLKQAHPDMLQNQQKYGVNKLDNDKPAKIHSRLQLLDFPSRHPIFTKIQHFSKKAHK